MRHDQKIDPPAGNSNRSYARKVARQILDTYQGDVDSEITVGASGTAFVLIDMAEKDLTVVTPGDIRHAAEIFATDIAELSEPQITIDIKTWLSYLGLVDVDVDYCPEWVRWETIWIAPVFPDLNDIISYLGDPTAVSIPKLQKVVEEAFSDPEEVDSDAFAGGERDPEEKELDAYLGYIKQELHQNWVPVSNTDGLIWANPERINDLLRSKGDVLNFNEMTSVISDALKQSSHVDDDLLPETIDDENIGPLMDVLQESYGWLRLGTVTGISWYSDQDAFKKDYEKHAIEAQEILDNRGKASIEKLQRARTFFRHNQEILLEWEDTSQHQLEKVVERLGYRINALRQETRIDSSEPGDNLSSAVETRTPSEYHVAKEFEERLENMREDEDEEEQDKGLKGYRY